MDTQTTIANNAETAQVSNSTPTATSDSKTTEELPRDILTYQKKSARLTRVAAIAVLVIVLAFAGALVLLIPRAIGLIDHAKESLSELDTIVSGADDIMNNVDEMMGNVNGLLDEANVLIGKSNDMISKNTDAVTETIQKLNNMDFETLNNAIEDLSDVVEPLAKFFNVFNR